MIIASMIALPLSLSPRAVLTGTFLFGSDWYVALASYPDLNFSNFPVFINQAWTLGAEITFYAFAPLLVRSLPASICVLLLSAACRLSFVRVYGFDNTWTYTFFPSTVMFFVIGHFARLIGDRLPTHKLLGVGLFAASMLVSAHGISYQKWDNLNFYISILLFALSLPGIFALTKRSGWMNSVGNLSYPMYLTHKMTLFGIYGLFPFIGTAIARSDKLFVPGFVSVLSVLAICIAISVVAHIVIEQPVAKSMWRLLRRRPHIAATAPAQARANPEKYSPPPNSRVKHEIR